MSYTMKLLISSAIVIVLIVTSVFVYHKNIHEDTVKERRYFYIGYDCSNEYRRDVGNITSSGDSLPSHEYFKDLIYNWKKCDGYSYKDIVIVGVHEFKDSLEYMKWKKIDGGTIEECIEGGFEGHPSFSFDNVGIGHLAEYIADTITSKWTDATSSAPAPITSKLIYGDSSVNKEAGQYSEGIKRLWDASKAQRDTMVITQFEKSSGTPAEGIGKTIELDTLPLTADNPLTASSTSYVQLGGKLIYNTTIDTTLFYSTAGMWIREKQDTIPVMMLVCDTASKAYPIWLSDTIHKLKEKTFYSNGVWWDFGYEVRFTGVYTPRYIYFEYLDKDKKPLEKNIVVFTTKER